VNGSLTIGVAQARKRRGTSLAKGGRGTLARRSSSRERRVRGDGSAASFVLRRGRGVRGICRWKAPWIGDAHAFHEAPAEPVLAAFEPSHGTEKPVSCKRRGGGDRGASGDRFFDFTRRKKTPPREDRPVAKVGVAP